MLLVVKRKKLDLKAHKLYNFVAYFFKNCYFLCRYTNMLESDL